MSDSSANGAGPRVRATAADVQILVELIDERYVDGVSVYGRKLDLPRDPRPGTSTARRREPVPDELAQMNAFEAMRAARTMEAGPSCRLVFVMLVGRIGAHGRGVAVYVDAVRGYRPGRNGGESGAVQTGRRRASGGGAKARTVESVGPRRTSHPHGM